MDDGRLRELVAEKADVDPDIVDRVLIAFQDTVLVSLRSNEAVVLNGFGVWNSPTHDEPFAFLCDVGELCPEVPENLIVGVDGEGVEELVGFLSTARSHRDIFGTDDYEGLDERWRPAGVSGDEVHEAAHAASRRIQSDAIRDRVVYNLGSSVA